MKHAYLAPAALLAALILVAPVQAGQVAAFSLMGFAAYKAARHVLKRKE